MHGLLSNIYFYKGDYAKAMDESRKVLAMPGNESMAIEADKAYRNGGFQTSSLEFLRNLNPQRRKEYVSPLPFAKNPARPGQKEQQTQHLKPYLHHIYPHLQ